MAKDGVTAQPKLSEVQDFLCSNEVLSLRPDAIVMESPSYHAYLHVFHDPSLVSSYNRAVFGLYVPSMSAVWLILAGDAPHDLLALSEQHQQVSKTNELQKLKSPLTIQYSIRIR